MKAVMIVLVMVVLFVAVAPVATASGSVTAKSAGKEVTAGVAAIQKDGTMAAAYKVAQAELPMTGSNCQLMLDGYWTGGKDNHPSAACSDGPTTLAYCAALNLGKVSQRALVGADGRLTKAPQALVEQCAATGKAAQTVTAADFTNK